MSLARYTAPLVAAAFTVVAVCAAARCETYPEKPVTFIIPFAAGGGSDVIARLLQEDILKELGQPIVIENRAGANGAIGSAAAARAVPDGYTLMCSRPAPLFLSTPTS